MFKPLSLWHFIAAANISFLMVNSLSLLFFFFFFFSVLNWAVLNWFAIRHKVNHHVLNLKDKEGSDVHAQEMKSEIQIHLDSGIHPSFLRKSTSYQASAHCTCVSEIWFTLLLLLLSRFSCVRLYVTP